MKWDSEAVVNNTVQDFSKPDASLLLRFVSGSILLNVSAEGLKIIANITVMVVISIDTIKNFNVLLI